MKTMELALRRGLVIIFFVLSFPAMGASSNDNFADAYGLEPAMVAGRWEAEFSATKIEARVFRKTSSKIPAPCNTNGISTMPRSSIPIKLPASPVENSVAQTTSN